MSSEQDDAVLDDPDRLATADPGGLLRAVATAGAQIREAVALTTESAAVDQLADLSRPRCVLLAADPGADDVATALAALTGGPEASAPVVRCDGPELPVWAGATDVLLAVAVSPQDPVAARLAEAAGRRGVTILGVGPADSPLHEACGRNRAPYVPLPVGPHPRAAFWGLLTPLLVAARELGLLLPAADPAGLVATADLLDALAERVGPARETYANPAKSLALELDSAMPVLWGTSLAAGAAARRAAGQLAAGGRSALWGTLPVAAGRIGGLLTAGPVPADDFFRDRVDEPEVVRPRLVLLRDPDEPGGTRRQADRLVEEAGRRGVPVTELAADEAAGPLGRFASLVGLLDFAAAYLGLASGGGAEPLAYRQDEGDEHR